MPLDSVQKTLEKRQQSEKFRLALSLDEAQTLFSLVGDSIPPPRLRKTILKIYRCFENHGFIDHF